MREISFRAWDITKKEMLTPDFSDEYDFFITPDGSVRCAYESGGNWDSTTLTKRKAGVVLMQFTGLKDKNGKEIFEGDARQNGNWVAWNQLHCCFGWFNASGYQKDMLASEYDDNGNIRNEWMVEDEIIGNIHEHPNLIK